MSIKVTSMKYDKQNIKFRVCPFGTDWFCCHRCMLLGQIKNLFCCFLYWAQTTALREKNCFKFHGRYITYMSIVLAFTDFSEKKILWFLMESCD